MNELHEGEATHIENDILNLAMSHAIGRKQNIKSNVKSVKSRIPHNIVNFLYEIKEEEEKERKKKNHRNSFRFTIHK